MESVSSALAGYQESMLSTVQQYWIDNPRFAIPQNKDFSSQNGSTSRTLCIEEKICTPEQPSESPLSIPYSPPRQRRRSLKGQASGWIEKRTGNTRRWVPCISFYYCWTELDEDGKRRKCKQYIQNHLISDVQRLVEQERRPVAEILQVMSGRSRWCPQGKHVYDPMLGTNLQDACQLSYRTTGQ
ncbi:hypothetical protein H6F43_03410 [Leptolyngbya sp. FACHB-36]|uniref:hypothetical protein n=1 Tax=Leptolyngbya sp. FACHB-36 TaxID=2692808 RepID=UPI001680B671|nr:hypothetical protein [Leptolyngbya sp. FACHB-36]MBD2019229.1 hypothetical protein [Leptolyngbya sp. FACHB-36]